MIVPATVRLASRAAPGLAATTREMLAVPVPEVAPETVIQDGRPLTDQAQVEPVVMVSGTLPPAEFTC